MRKRLIAFWLVLFAIPAMAADTETVTVENASIIGVWKINLPQSFSFHLLGKTEWGPMVDQFCQMEEIRRELTVHCLGFRINRQDVSRGSLSIKGNRIRMAWGSMMLYFAMNGTLRSAGQFEGTVSVQALGISSDAPDKATGTRLSLSANAPDTGGKSGLLARVLQEMADGVFVVPSDANADQIKILKPETLRPMGAIQSIIYLGETVFKNTAPPVPDSHSVYDVEFENGHLICGLHRRADGGLDNFDCG